jgi:hypothetical protein
MFSPKVTVSGAYMVISMYSLSLLIMLHVWEVIERIEPKLENMGISWTVVNNTPPHRETARQRKIRL